MAGRGNFRIEPFQNRVQNDSNFAVQAWKMLEDAIDQIYNQNAATLSYEELYR